MFVTIKENISAEIIEKKSKFIANLVKVEDKIQVENEISKIKKKYHDARHNCIAYRIITKEGVIEKSSDDGEPSGTAGMPMLNILQKNNLCNILIVVTRYFGGILLGTGGLVRSYSKATEKVLLDEDCIFKDIGLEVKFYVSYSDLEKIKYYFEKNNIKILNTNFKENVEIIFEILEKKLNDILKNKQNLNFNIIESVILKEKYIEICV